MSKHLSSKGKAFAAEPPGSCAPREPAGGKSVRSEFASNITNITLLESGAPEHLNYRQSSP